MPRIQRNQAYGCPTHAVQNTATSVVTGVISVASETVLDIYLPDSPAPAAGYPAILLIHGGGWHVGDKDDERQVQIALLLAAHGYAVYNLNYTLAPADADRNAYALQAFQQCQQASAWVRKHAALWQIDCARIAAIGASAGANMALMLGFKTDAPIDAPTTAGHTQAEGATLHIQAVINLYAPVTRPRSLLVIDQIHADGPPVLSIHGDADHVVSVEESRILDARLRAVGVFHQLIIIPHAPHTFNLISPWGDFSQIALKFLEQHLDKA